jgi:hypothetical protein
MGGQFARRLTILRETLLEAGAPARVIEHWLAYTESQRALVTRDPEGQCIGPASDAAATTPPRRSRRASDP